MKGIETKRKRRAQPSFDNTFLSLDIDYDTTFLEKNQY